MVVRESAPRMTPLEKVMAMLVGKGGFREGLERGVGDGVVH